MNILDVLGSLISPDTIVALVTGILGGQKLRITLGGNKIPVKALSPKVSGKRVKRTPRPALGPSPSPSTPDTGLPYMVDQPSLFTETADLIPDKRVPGA